MAKNKKDSTLKKFSHKVGQNWYHIVLVPKGRFPVFQWKILHELAGMAIEDVCNRHLIELFTYEVMEDHVHLFVSCPPKYSINKLLGILKGGTSFYIRKRYPSLKKYKHLWSKGGTYRSLGSVSADVVRFYIDIKNTWKGVD